MIENSSELVTLSVGKYGALPADSHTPVGNVSVGNSLIGKMKTKLAGGSNTDDGSGKTLLFL